MEVKTIEIRDSATFIPALAIKLKPECEEDRYLLARAGYGLTPQDQSNYILLLDLNGGEGRYNCDPHGWAGPATTWYEAHQWLENNWADISSGDVLDVEHEYGRTPKPKLSERLTNI